jgi:hypothetical protein
LQALVKEQENKKTVLRQAVEGENHGARKDQDAPVPELFGAPYGSVAAVLSLHALRIIARKSIAKCIVLQ